MLNSKIFDSLLEPVFIVDATEKILYCNEPAAIICELSARKLMRGSTLSKALKFDADLELLKTLESVSDPTPYQEVGFSSTSGKRGKAQITVQPFLSTHGQWLIYFRDVTLEETLQKKYRAELEQVQHYSHNLEKMVDERTAQVKALNQTMTALLNSLHQGFLIFNRDGVCQEVFSQACESVLETRPPGKKIWDVLKLSTNEIEDFKKWMQTVFEQMLPFQDLSTLGPNRYTHSKGQQISLEYYEMKDGASQVSAIIMVASDITDLVRAEKEAQVEKAQSKMIVTLIKSKRHIASFLRDSRQLLTGLEQETAKGLELDVENCYRLIHTLKGGASSFSIKPLTDLCHETENLLSQMKWNGANVDTVSSIYYNVKILEEKFLHFQHENTELLGIASQSQERVLEIPISQIVHFKERYLTFHPELARALTEQILMEPVQKSFEQYSSIAHGIADSLGKTVEDIHWMGGDIRVLPEFYSELSSSFIHLVRNSLDHGIETPEERMAKGKSPKGSIKISFEKTVVQHREQLLITFHDDGGGIDIEKLKLKLSQNGIDLGNKNDNEVLQFIFQPHISTKDQVSELSGRGVGMDAVAFAAEKLNGKIWASSVQNEGTQIFIQVPFNTALPNLLPYKKVS